jgi:hypothetical protein
VERFYLGDIDGSEAQDEVLRVASANVLAVVDGGQYFAFDCRRHDMFFLGHDSKGFYFVGSPEPANSRPVYRYKEEEPWFKRVVDQLKTRADAVNLMKHLDLSMRER